MPFYASFIVRKLLTRLVILLTAAKVRWTYTYSRNRNSFSRSLPCGLVGRKRYARSGPFSVWRAVASWVKNIEKFIGMILQEFQISPSSYLEEVAGRGVLVTCRCGQWGRWVISIARLGRTGAWVSNILQCDISLYKYFINSFAIPGDLILLGNNPCPPSIIPSSFN